MYFILNFKRLKSRNFKRVNTKKQFMNKDNKQIFNLKFGKYLNKISIFEHKRTKI